MVKDIIVGGFLMILGTFGLWQSWLLWHNPGYAKRMMLYNMVLPFSKQVRRGSVRGALPLAIGTELAAAGVLVFAATAQGRSQLGVIVAASCFGAMLLAIGTQVAIILFNCPRWLVPPHMREERGTIKLGGGGRGENPVKSRLLAEYRIPDLGE